MRLGRNCFVNMTEHDENRINADHFDGNGAGRFMGPVTWQGIVDHPVVHRQLIQQMSEADIGEFFIEIEMPYPIGWNSTLPLWENGVLPLDHLIYQREMNGWNGLFVRSNTHLLAKATNKLYIYGNLGRSHGNTRLKVYAFRPGARIGDLSGDMSYKHDIVFLDFGHPGEQIY